MTLTDRNSDPVVVGDDLVLAGKVYKDLGSNRALVESGGQLHVMDTADCLLAASIGGTGGETNTASNVGTAGVGIFKQKTGVDLELKKLNAGSSKVTITDDTGNSEVDIDVAPANFTGIPQSGVTNLTSDLAGKASTAHTHAPGDVILSATNVMVARSAAGGGPAEELPANTTGLAIMAAPSVAAARSVLALGTAALVDTGTSAANVPTITQADARYSAAAHTHSGVYQPVDATLTALAGLATGADKLPYSTGTDTFAQADLTTAGRALIDDADASAQRTTLGLGTAAVVNTGTSSGNVPLMSQHVDYIDIPHAGLPMKFTATGDVPTHSHSGTYQPVDATLTALAGLATGADKVPYSTGTDTFAQADLSAAGRALIDDADASAQRTTLGLGTAATRAVGVGASDLVDVTTLVATFQGLDAELTALAGLNSTAGLVEQTGAAAFTKRAIGVAASTDIPTRAHILRPLAQTLDSAEITTSAAEQTLCDLTVPASAMGANGGVELRLELFFYNATGANVSSTVAVYWGGTKYWGDVYGAHPSDSTYHAVTIRVCVDNLGATNKQRVSGFISGSVNTGAGTGEGNWGTTSPSNPFSNAQSSYPAKDTTSAQNVKVTWQMGTSSANARIKLDVARLILIPGA